jgi:hypothetical protein
MPVDEVETVDVELALVLLEELCEELDVELAPPMPVVVTVEVDVADELEELLDAPPDPVDSVPS